MFQFVEEEELEVDVSNLTIYEQAVSYPPRGWESVFEKCHLELEIISEIVEKHGEYYPNPNDLYRAFRMIPLNKVRVVFLGQSPYPSKTNACGMSFSTRGPVAATLRNIYKELKRQYDDFVIPKHGDLSEWAFQGVLLLNSTLTYFPNETSINKREFWTPFIVKIIKSICDVNPKCIFVLWGNHAKTFKQRITTERILEGVHPSPNAQGFIGCGHFERINEMLREDCEPQIDWRL